MKSSFTQLIPHTTYYIQVQVQQPTASVVIKLELATVHRRRCPPAPPSSSCRCSHRRRRRRRQTTRASCGRPPRIAWRRRRRGRRGCGCWAPCSSAPRTRPPPCPPGTGAAAAASSSWVLQFLAHGAVTHPIEQAAELPNQSQDRRRTAVRTIKHSNQSDAMM
ncbi:hypothetical protein BAE44_0020394 [Dichanthelium oligosanthes]|uniref:Uncharacterized protein n=1 Tax=Dichanthelium oligosanthes TaxID=888268 RepID=A0A1E5V0B7_9POAL|nr:hypothetical protein BAE44_0020394 [Dichanthelium oligosanthes]